MRPVVAVVVPDGVPVVERRATGGLEGDWSEDAIACTRLFAWER